MREKNRADLQKKLCKSFCHYYKSAKDHDLACMGFIVIERLLKEGLNISFHPGDRSLCAKTQEILTRDMCIACPFYASDCDFVQREKGSPPCGGFLLLGQLLERSTVTIDNIKEVG